MRVSDKWKLLVAGDLCTESAIASTTSTPFLTQPSVPWASAPFGCSQQGPRWKPDPRGELSQSESFGESALAVAGHEPVNGMKLLTWGQSWYYGKSKLQNNLKKKKKRKQSKLRPPRNLQTPMWRGAREDECDHVSSWICGPQRQGS